MSMLQFDSIEEWHMPTYLTHYRFGGKPLSEYSTNDPTLFERLPEWRDRAQLIFRVDHSYKLDSDECEMMLTKEGIRKLIQQLQQIAERM